MIARMKRESTPVDAATDVMALLMSAISSEEGLGTFHCVQLCWMLSLLAVKRVSKLNHELEDGQPLEISPVPP